MEKILSQLRRKPHRRCCTRTTPTILNKRYSYRYAGNRTVANTITLLWILATLISLISLREYALVLANDDNYAAQADDYGNNNNANNDDAAAAAANGDDAANAADEEEEETVNDDAAAAQKNTDDSSSSSSSNSAYENEQQQYQDTDDDSFHWNENIGFDGVSVMPLSCINYNSGHMIKFQLFDSANSYQCHFSEISTFVVSISHYMRAYFNYQALKDGNEFELPTDAAYLELNGANGAYLYAKVGCMDRETFTSTKLQLHLYTDQQCSQKFQDGQSARQHANRGYDLGGYRVPSKVTFKPDFYSCLTCSPDEVSGTFNKINNNWYDDDRMSSYGKNGNDGDRRQLTSTDKDFNNIESSIEIHSREAQKAYHDAFWAEYSDVQRRLNDNNYYDVGDWNMCQRIYKYGIWCDEECRSLDFFRTNLWSVSDIFLLSIMCTFMTAMILLVIAKRLKAQQKTRMYGEEHSIPGLPPCAMAIIFFVVMAVIITLAELKFINETLVFAVVTCTLLFIYMLKLTLFEHRKPVLLAAPRHDMFDNPLDDHLFS